MERPLGHQVRTDVSEATPDGNHGGHLLLGFEWQHDVGWTVYIAATLIGVGTVFRLEGQRGSWYDNLESGVHPFDPF